MQTQSVAYEKSDYAQYQRLRMAANQPCDEPVDESAIAPGQAYFLAGEGIVFFTRFILFGLVDRRCRRVRSADATRGKAWRIVGQAPVQLSQHQKTKTSESD